MGSCRSRKALSILALLAISMTNGAGAAPSAPGGTTVRPPAQRVKTPATNFNAPVATPSMRPVLTQSRAVGKRVLRSRALLAPAASLVGDGFSGSSTAPNAWLAVGNACLTAGTNATPATSIPLAMRTRRKIPAARVPSN